jgi:ABC-2 type transport system ATP-binding protein
MSATASGPDRAPGCGPEISARGLSRRFGPHTALADVDLDVPAGSTFALLGANGAGKTTFLRLVTGTLLPSAGEVRVAGISPAEDPARVQARLGYVMETSRLYPELRVQGFLRFFAGARGLARGEREAAVERAIDRFGLGPVAKRLVGNLSKGYQQRVSLAQAFLHDPPLVIVDEPTGGLDPVQRRDVQERLHALRGERTILLSTHDLDEARELADRAAVLCAGRLVAEGAAAELLGGDDPLALFRAGPAPAPGAARAGP